MKKEGLVEFTYSKDLGKRKKGDKVKMHSTTAAALESKDFGKAGKAIEIEKPEDLISTEAEKAKKAARTKRAKK